MLKCAECDAKAHAKGLCSKHYKRATSSRPVLATRDMTLIERFFHYVEKTDGCWNWTGATFGDGRYGSFWVEGKTVSAHTFSYRHHIGHIPEGMCVCHKCDNPLCVNPNHFFLGTNKDNSRDMVNKGRCRVASGDAHYKTKIAEADIPRIIEMCKTMKQVDVAKLFSVDPSHISRIARGAKRGRAHHVAPRT